MKHFRRMQTFPNRDGQADMDISTSNNVSLKVRSELVFIKYFNVNQIYKINIKPCDVKY